MFVGGPPLCLSDTMDRQVLMVSQLGRIVQSNDLCPPGFEAQPENTVDTLSDRRLERPGIRQVRSCRKIVENDPAHHPIVVSTPALLAEGHGDFSHRKGSTKAA